MGWRAGRTGPGVRAASEGRQEEENQPFTQDLRSDFLLTFKWVMRINTLQSLERTFRKATRQKEKGKKKKKKAFTEQFVQGKTLVGTIRNTFGRARK